MNDNKDYLSVKQEHGSIQISEEVIASIAAVAALEVEGVSGLSANLTADIAEKFGRKNLGKGVKVSFRENAIAIDCFVIALYGYSVIDIAKNVQDRVKSAVESMTGQPVRSINVEISGITLPKEPKK